MLEHLSIRPERWGIGRFLTGYQIRVPAYHEPVSDRTTTVAEARDPRAADGRVPGRRGLATRQRMMDATGVLLETVAYRDLKVVDIAREAGTSPATFYQYFPDVEAAVLAMAADLGEAWAEPSGSPGGRRDA